MRRAALLVILAVAAPAGAGQGRAPFSDTPSLSAYVARLDALATGVRAAPAGDRAAASRLLPQIPLAWVVTAPDRTWRVRTDLLQSTVADWQRHPDAAHRQAVVACLDTMRAQAASVERPPADAARARAALTDVLSARAFRNVHGPSAFDRLRQQVLAWLLRVLTHLFGASAIPAITTLFTDVLVVLAVAAAALWMFRVLRRTQRHDGTTLDLQAAPPRPWDEWLVEARAEAAGGRWAEAVRRAYWCGIALLEARGAWRPDPSRTPREYLALVPAGTPAADLRALTRLAEHVWYGRATADASSFDEAVACLRSMGCPSV
jgi:Domain of unknown function (DUF4129)